MSRLRPTRHALRLRLADLTASGQGDLRAVVGEFRRSEVLVPLVEGSLVSAQAGGPVGVAEDAGSAAGASPQTAKRS
ncbi:hypothetical protein ACIBW9_04910 [Streptomyces sp. NPDC049541]|uniref:hypothetical protein n=1 Tax=Streptomyces sp. NPDC049541 TaxID=3365594 RepID=UPI0037925535